MRASLRQASGAASDALSSPYCVSTMDGGKLMNVLIVHAHPEPASFSSAMCQVAVEELTSAGHSVVVSDLYQQKFNPVASAEDFSSPKNPKYLTYALEQRHGYEGRSIAPDILEEIEKVRACDLLILNFPIFWFSTPAILKGWIDRVFVSGLFYGGRRIYDHGGMGKKRALAVFTLGGREHMFGEGSLHGDLNGILKPLLQGSLGYVGMQVLEPFAAYHIPYLKDAERVDILDRYRSYLRDVEAIPLLPMPKLKDFDESFRPIG